MATLIVSLLLFFLPLFVIPVTISPFEVPKVILAEILIEFLLFLFIVRASAASREPTIKTIINLRGALLIALFILTLIHLIFLSTPTTFFGNPYRLQGVFLFWHLLIFSLISSKLTLPLPPLLPLLSLFGLLIGTLILGGNEAGRAYGTLGEPNALAAAAIFIWPFAWYATSSLRSGDSRRSNLFFKLATVTVTLTIIFLSGSRSGLLAILIQAIFLAFTRFRLENIGKSTIICLILISLSLILPLIEPGGHWTENRSEVWSTSLLAGSISPIFGSGFGNIEYTLKETSRLANNNIQYQYVDSSHNFILDYWVQGGVLGTGLIVSILALSLLGLVRKKDRLLLNSFLGVLTVMSFNPVSVVTLLAFWFLAGQALASQGETLQEPRQAMPGSVNLRNH